MAKNQVDREAYLLLPVFIAGSASTVGLIASDFLQVIDLSTVVFSTVNIEWTLGRIIAVGALGVVTFHRDASIRETRGFDLWIMWATLGFLLAPPFFPVLAEYLHETPAGVVSFVVTGIGFSIISFKN